MGEYLLGIDIGTSACKVAAFGRDGQPVAFGSGDYEFNCRHPGWVEQNPDDWWRAVCQAVKAAMNKAGIRAVEIVGIGVAGQSWSAVAVDRFGKALANTPIWLDSRAAQICQEVRERVGADRIFSLSGNSLQPFYTTGKILWYRKHMPDVFQNTDKILQSNSYIVYRMTGRFSQDLSQGYGLHCFDMKKGIWDVAMGKELGIADGMLPELYPCHAVVGALTLEAARECGLCAGIPVVAGGLDAACGALGIGVIHNGETQEQGGQAGGMSICTDRLIADERLILSRHVVPGKWLLQGGTTGGGGVMRWLEREFAQYEREQAKRLNTTALDLMNEGAKAIAPGSDGLIFLPYMSGERSPIWNPQAKGVYYGLDFCKTKEHFIHAAMEGVAYSLKHNLDVAEEAGARVKVLKSMGGAANSLLWTQIKSDVTGKPIEVPSSDTATTLGAALLAGIGIGIYPNFSEAVKMTVENKRRHVPDESNRDVYDRNYHTYLEVYRNLKKLMNQKEGNA